MKYVGVVNLFRSTDLGRLQPGERQALDAKIFQEPTFQEIFRVIPVQLRIIGTENDADRPTRPRLIFAGDVRDGQTLVGRVEMMPEGHLRWKWVRLFVPFCLLEFTDEPFRPAEKRVKQSGGIDSFSLI